MKLPKSLAASAAALILATGVSFAGEKVVTTTSSGTLGDFADDSFVIRSETATEPLRYSYSKTTTYVDEAGAPVDIATIRTSHAPVTVHYVKEGDRLVANRVIVHKKVTAPAAVEERKTTTTTTTTKEKD
jgi:hypothetical protein